MMNKLYYLDIKLLSDQEVTSSFLMEKIMSAFHLIFVETERNNGSFKIGIGFPLYNKTKRELGNILRLYADSSFILENAIKDNRIKKFNDYLITSDIKITPETVHGYSQFRRVQFKENKERLVRRFARRHKTDIDLAEKEYVSFSPQKSELPYIVLDSKSSGHRFKLYIDEVYQEKNTGLPVFNSYGLTKTGSLPIF